MSPSDASWHIGIDTGGTFTDVVVMDGAGTITTAKSPTTWEALEEGVFAALGLAAAERGMTLDELLPRVAAIGQGTTKATNALIERSGVRTGLLTTAGFRDTLLVQRIMGFTAGVPTEKLGTYSERANPEPIVPRTRIREVRERIDQAGTVLLELDEQQAREAVEELVASGVRAIAVCLLWSFRNPVHEQRLGEIISEVAGDAVFVSLSSDINPVLGEYERTATTVLNSYLGPIMADHVDGLERRLRARGFGGVLRVLNSIGGVMASGDAATRAVLLLASGPTGGVIGSRYLAEALGHENVITSDMGGTSFDVGMIVDGRPVITPVTEVAKYHVSSPMIEITAIGAGGGSIAQVRDGLITVGPESAGAQPGPACYGRGGVRPTVTDADVVLGIIDPENFLGGRMILDLAAAERAIEEHLAEPLGIDVAAAAAGVRRIVDSQMADTLRELTIGRGHDPRDFVLYAYGGAGPMHCAGFGGDLGVGKIVVPRTSMVHSAYGALASDLLVAAERSMVMRGGGGLLEPWVGMDAGLLEREFAALERRCFEDIASNGVERSATEVVRSADLRYRRQTHELIVPVPSGPLDQDGLRGLIERFERMYEETYGAGAGFREAGVELTTLRVESIGRTQSPQLAAWEPKTNGAVHHRAVFDPRSATHRPMLIADWDALDVGSVVEGPAVVEHTMTTVFVGVDQRATLDDHGNLIITATTGAT